MAEKIDILIDKFNMVLLNMVNHITEYYDDLNSSSLKLILKDIIMDKPEEPISYFLLNVYKNDDYRKNILKQNDKFFIDEIDNNSESLSDGDEEKIAKLFEFKNLWQKIDIDTKNYIKKSMLILIKICQKYILTL